MENQIVQQAIEQLKDENVRITPQRYAILEYLIEHRSHPTADEIYHAIETRFPNISVATVYNNLRLFTKIGFVDEMSYGDNSSCFDFVTEPHYHAICRECGKVTDFFYPGLEDVETAASQLTGYQIDDHRLEVYGLCPDCVAKKEAVQNKETKEEVAKKASSFEQ